MPTATLTPTPIPSPIQIAKRYALHAEIASGGMAAVHFGRWYGPMGFARVVAIKRLHPQFARNPDFVAMFLDEGRVAARVRHPNVLPTLDIVVTDNELFLIMEYVHGESLARLVRRSRERGYPPPLRVVGSIMSGVLHGLHAAHEARDEHGELLGLVHRDVSPQNVLVGCDGIARLLDFGVAKAAGRVQTSISGQLKGKLSYMPPELFRGETSRQTDVYAAAVVLWELLTGNRLFKGDNEAMVIDQILNRPVAPPSTLMVKGHMSAQTSGALDKVTLRGLDRDPTRRYSTAREMAVALERAIGVASSSEVGEWVEAVAQNELHRRAARLAALEKSKPSTEELDAAPETNMGPIPGTELAAHTGSQVFLRRTLPDADVSFVPTPVPVSHPESHARLAVDSDSDDPWLEYSRARRRRNAFILAVVALGSVAALMVLIVVWRARGGSLSPKPAPQAAAIASAPQAPSASHRASAAAPAETAAPVPAIEARAIVPTESDAGMRASPKKVTPAPPSHKRAPTPIAMPAPPATPPQGSAATCDPPFVVDAAGHKQYKRECL
ncbi:serine/threonine protein kinase [Pendulispora rubella]|uniref:Serine/threonine protein kinase n=1 Tax=Pendulispora rubella TaxID=2741070 RepID=A0ABZ2L2L3_9BACT